MVCVDEFRLSKSAQCRGFVLTHCHSDHYKIPHRSRDTIHCSPNTANILRHDNRLQGTLTLGWHRIAGDDVYVFGTNHCIGSIGIFNRRSGNLHFGDCRLSLVALGTLKQTLSDETILTVTGDDYISSHWPAAPSALPSVAQSMELLRKCINKLSGQGTARICIRIKHTGMIDCLPTGFKYEWGFVPTATMARAFALTVHSLARSGPVVYLSQGEWEDDDIDITIIPSCNYFFKQGVSVESPIVDDMGHIRIFLSAHSSRDEYRVQLGFING